MATKQTTNHFLHLANFYLQIKVSPTNFNEIKVHHDTTRTTLFLITASSILLHNNNAFSAPLVRLTSYQKSPNNPPKMTLCIWYKQICRLMFYCTCFLPK